MSSQHVAAHWKPRPRKTGSIWYSFKKYNRPSDGEGWELFGKPDATHTVRRAKRV